MTHGIPNYLVKGSIFKSSINEAKTMCAEPSFLKTASHSAAIEISLQDLGPCLNGNRDKEASGLARG